jgi:hypothetical protein
MARQPSLGLTEESQMVFVFHLGFQLFQPPLQPSHHCLGLFQQQSGLRCSLRTALVQLAFAVVEKQLQQQGGRGMLQCALQRVSE